MAISLVHQPASDGKLSDGDGDDEEPSDDPTSPKKSISDDLGALSFLVEERISAPALSKLPQVIGDLHCPLPITCSPLPITFCLPAIANCPLPTVYRPLPTVYRVPPTVYCPLSAAHFPLPTTHYLLPTIHCPLPTDH